MDPREELLRRAFSTFPRFCGLVDIIPKDLNASDSAEQTNRRSKLVLNAIQRIFCIERTGRDIVLKPRQIGFCLSPDTRVLTADLRWVPIGDLDVGTEVVAVDEDLQDVGEERLRTRRMRTAVVEAKRFMRAEAYRITFDDGRSLVCTDSHPWLSRNASTDAKWRSLSGHGNKVDGRLKLGVQVRWITKPWDAGDIEDGWFGGMLDGEGSMRKAHHCPEVCITQRLGRVWDRMVRYAAERGYAPSLSNDQAERPSKFGHEPVPKLNFGRMDQLFRLIGQTRPTRFLGVRFWEGRALPGRRNSDGIGWATITGIEPIGEQVVVDLQTSRSTYIAEGFVSHNTTLEEARDIYYALKHPGAQVVTVCQSQTDNAPLKNLSRGYRVMFEGLKASGVDIKFRTFSETHWEIADTGSTIKLMVAGSSEAAASKKGRAGTIHRLHLTETAFYEHADTTLNALLECVPSLSAGSEIVNESTPNGAAGYFYEQCKAAEQGRSAYKFHFYPWYAHGEYRTPLSPGESLPPPLSEEQAELEAKLRKLGVTDEQLLWYRHKAIEKGQNVEQEYPNDPETCFLVSGRPFFDQRITAQLVRGAAEPVESRKGGRIRIYAKPEPGHDYVVALDCSEGIGGDPSGAVVYHRATGEHVASIDGQFQPHDAGDVSVAICKEYNDALLAVERNNHGHAVLMAVKNFGYRRVYRHSDDKRGWPTNTTTRPIMLDGLEEAHRKGQWKTRDKALLAQMRKFMINNNGKPEAATGAHDDLVISAAIGWAVRQRRSIRGDVGADLAGAL